VFLLNWGLSSMYKRVQIGRHLRFKQFKIHWEESERLKEGKKQLTFYKLMGTLLCGSKLGHLKKEA